jgi:hypothetical protein
MRDLHNNIKGSRSIPAGCDHHRQRRHRRPIIDTVRDSSRCEYVIVQSGSSPTARSR